MTKGNDQNVSTPAERANQATYAIVEQLRASTALQRERGSIALQRLMRGDF